MKNILFNKGTIGLMIILSTVNLSLASDNISIPVSCTIPAVPGLNAPLIKEETVKTGETEEIKTDSPIMIQEDTKKEIRLADGRTISVIVQTIYSR